MHPTPAGLLPAAIDGKALTGARTPTGQVFLVGALAHTSGAVIGQTQVPDKHGEGAAALALPGWVFTLDALHTTRKTARLITGPLASHYVLILNGKDADWTETTASEDEHGHGHTERRSIRTTPVDDALFPGAARSNSSTCIRDQNDTMTALSARASGQGCP